jgi:hypothetical protein
MEEVARSNWGEDGMDTRPNRAAIEKLWRQALTTYQEAGLEEHLKAKWSGDPNVTQRITYDYPPTFQPGYVGRHYFEGRRRIVLLGQNPGPGRKADDEDLVYRPGLEAFARGETSFQALNESLALRVVKWGVFAEKGIFREGRAGRAALLAEDVRPSIHEISYVNHFPFKILHTSGRPRKTSFQKHVWETYVWQVLKHLEPTVIIRYPWSNGVHAQLQTLVGSSAVLRVWHPSKFNYGRRYKGLVESWRAVSEHLRDASA